MKQTAQTILSAFIQEIKDEFKDQNWDYLDFIAERVINKLPSEEYRLTASSETEGEWKDGENPYSVAARKAQAFGKGYGNGDYQKECLAHNIYHTGFWDAIEYFGQLAEAKATDQK